LLSCCHDRQPNEEIQTDGRFAPQVIANTFKLKIRRRHPII